MVRASGQETPKMGPNLEQVATAVLGNVRKPNFQVDRDLSIVGDMNAKEQTC